MIITRTLKNLGGGHSRAQLAEWGTWERAKRFASHTSLRDDVTKVEIYGYVSDPNDYSIYENGEKTGGYS